MRRALVHILSTFLVLVLACESIAENRVALVIGNGSYAEAPLSNPPNDATLMAQTLRALGFEVAVHINSDQRTIKRAIQDFGRRLETAGKDTVGLFYYAGHGVQANGVNYLIPIEASIKREADLVIEAVEARWVLAQMDFAGNRLNMVILDACRNNPYRATFRSATRGLVRMEAPKGSLIAYATAPNQVARDGVGANSPYTETLAAIMQRPGLPVLEMFNTVGVQVAARTNGQQQPWVSTSPLPGDFYFVPKQSAVPLAVKSPTPAFDERTLDLAFWDSIKHSKDWRDYQAYLDQYGERGAFSRLARVRRDRLKGVLPQQSPAAPPSSAAELEKGDDHRPGSTAPETLATLDTAKAQRLSSEELMTLFSGHTHRGETAEGTHFTVEYQADGDMYGRSGKWTDSGNWSLEGDQFCRRFSSWRDGEKHCFTIVKDGETYKAFRENRVWSHFRQTK